MNSLKKTETLPSPCDGLVEVSWVARRAGVKPRTVYLWVEQDRIPCYRFGKLVRFDPEEVEAWLKRHHKATGGKHNERAG